MGDIQHHLTHQKLPSSILVINNTANKSMVLRTETPLVLFVGLSQLPMAESQMVLLLVRGRM